MTGDAVVDPATVFGMMFGSDMFEEYVGQLAMASVASMGLEEKLPREALQAKLQLLNEVTETLNLRPYTLGCCTNERCSSVLT